METDENVLKQVFLRVVIIAGTGVLLGYALYGGYVFMPSMVPFQFTESSITAGLAYAFLQRSTHRNLAAALCGWYFIATLTFSQFNPWLPVLNLAYILGITGAIVAYTYAVAKLSANTPLVRIALAGAIVSVANGIIVLVLQLASWNFTMYSISYMNMKYGAMIGLGIGVGIELAEYADRNLAAYAEDHA